MKLSNIFKLSSFAIGSVDAKRLMGRSPFEERNLEESELSMPGPTQESSVDDEGLIKLLQKNGVDKANISDLMTAWDGSAKKMLGGFFSRSECVAAVELIFPFDIVGPAEFLIKNLFCDEEEEEPKCNPDPFIGTWSGSVDFADAFTLPTEVVFNNGNREVGQSVATYSVYNDGNIVCSGDWTIYDLVSPSVMTIIASSTDGGDCRTGCVTTLISNCDGDTIGGVENYAPQNKDTCDVSSLASHYTYSLVPGALL
mmetsp:Transcript_24720/g.59594  ORF Transcript_24720/g.59594 Transcript_24720/m.59594 type:complete len:255 (+) Transcript_24720:93-857(+)|eukprot:CAMPEP_0181108618 /NCGR_PEP_ID=MMETSP1071-20121207/17725_1 /TAXON_ID=35127 /ORGANISM="Thalassiosira sp., Strain NH16" /LENGTH=254 /DNA_ID=CAMNT_0023192231 /DNA_START=65 /DNA_END=829 /DNA_ORIENTATION=-